MDTKIEAVYDLCAEPGCWHFVDENWPYTEQDEGIAPFIHLDDGEKEYDHDAVPSGKPETLRIWRLAFPELFWVYSDGKIGPNSGYFRIANAVEVKR